MLDIVDLSIVSKLKLAYKIVECGFFLLETPWLSSLYSQNLRHAVYPDGVEPNVTLRICASNLEEMVCRNPGALVETSQLFHIGVVLLDIALGENDRETESEIQESAYYQSSRIPPVEDLMGIQYAKAAAFCLQSRNLKRQFSSPEKYNETKIFEWQSYMDDLLVKYHSQVLLRYINTPSCVRKLF